MIKSKKVYISAEKPSEVIPLLAEGLLLYDKIYMDICDVFTFNVLAANLCAETFENLICDGILNFVYPEKAPIIAKNDENGFYRILLMSLDNIISDQITDVKKQYNSIYPLHLINKIFDSTKPTKVDYNQILENCYMDFNNIYYTTDVFKYIQNYFELPDFHVEADGNGIKLNFLDGEKKIVDRVMKEGTYGLHLMAEVNYKMALLSSFDEIVCEKEYESFFSKKLKTAFLSYKHRHVSDNLMELCEINDFPDIKELVSAGLFTIEDIIKLRNGDGKILRTWLDTVTMKCISDNTRFSKECAKIFTKSGSNFPLPSRTVVFGLMQALSLVKPIESILLSTAKELIVPKIIDQWEPRFFFDRARKMKFEKQKSII